jgi:hypothetical protein
MAPLESGILIGHAPRFHLARSWNERLQVNSGVIVDSDRLWPRDDWRNPSVDELRLLTTADEAAPAVRLFNIPPKIRDRWWQFAAGESASPPGRAAPTFEQIAGEVIEFLQFKRLPLPAASTLEVVVNAPGQPSTRPNLGGLTAEPTWPGMIGGINLGDQESSLILLNLGEAHLRSSDSGISRADRFHDRVRAFLTTHDGYPLLRVRLLPCEGYWLPAGTVAFDGDTRGQTEIDVQLIIKASPS